MEWLDLWSARGDNSQWTPLVPINAEFEAQMEAARNEIMPLMFAARRKFDSSDGERWTGYINWSGFHHIQEIVSTDHSLCPNVIETLLDADWEFNVQADNRHFFFYDFEYLKRRVGADLSRCNILALIERPTTVPAPIAGFEFCGYDILDSDDSFSVLVNCGPFPGIYTPEELNPQGLVSDLGRATKIAETIRKTHSDDHHCRDCRPWGIARYRGAK